VRNERLAYSECYDVPRLGSPEWLTTVTFEHVGRGVKVTHNIRQKSREARDGHLQAGMEAGSMQTPRRLDESFCANGRILVMIERDQRGRILLNLRRSANLQPQFGFAEVPEKRPGIRLGFVKVVNGLSAPRSK